MEEKELLHALKKPHLLVAFIILLIIFANANASESALEDRSDIGLSLATDAQNFVMEDARSKFGEISPKNARELAQQKEPKMLIFVSSSMPLSLLKAYAKEAKDYNGTLVFKGLPHGSFKELSKLISEIYEDYDQAQSSHAGSIIDDEAFAKFEVTSVPTIILAEEKECFREVGCKVTYDKLVGNIGIKAALEKFKDEGEIREVASNLLMGRE